MNNKTLISSVIAVVALVGAGSYAIGRTSKTAEAITNTQTPVVANAETPSVEPVIAPQTVDASDTSNPALNPVSALNTESAPINPVKPLKPKADDIERLMELGFSKADAKYICTYTDPATIEMSEDSWVKAHILERAKVVESQFKAPNAYLASKDTVAYLQTHGYTIDQANDLIKHWDINPQFALLYTNVDLDKDLEIDAKTGNK